MTITKGGSLVLGDAGSTGTRFYIFENDGGVFKQKCNAKCNAKLGDLVSGAKDATWYAEELGKLLSKLAQTCGTDFSGPDLQILIQTTAGSRKEVNNRAKKDSFSNEEIGNYEAKVFGDFYSKKADIITACGADCQGFTLNALKVNIIAGRFEAIYGWLALYNNFKISGGDYKFQEVCKGHDGAANAKACMNNLVYYEVGGASSQVAWAQHKATCYARRKHFRFNKQSKSASKGPMAISLKANGFELDDGSSLSLKVFTKSWLIGGMNELLTGIEGQLNHYTGKKTYCLQPGADHSSKKVRGEDRWELCRAELSDFFSGSYKDITWDKDDLQAQMTNVQDKLACDGYSGAGSHYKTLYINCKSCYMASKQILDPTAINQKYFVGKNYIYYPNPTFYKQSFTTSPCEVPNDSSNPYFAPQCLGLVYPQVMSDLFKWAGPVVVAENEWFEGSQAYESIVPQNSARVNTVNQFTIKNTNINEDAAFVNTRRRKRSNRRRLHY